MLLIAAEIHSPGEEEEALQGRVVPGRATWPACCLVLAVCALPGCASGVVPGEDEDPPPVTGVLPDDTERPAETSTEAAPLQLHPARAYTGMLDDGEVGFWFPASATGPDGSEISAAEWRSSDEEIVRTTRSGEQLLVVPYGPGLAELTVTANGVVRQMPVLVTPYTQDQLDTGRALYHEQLGCAGCHANGPDVTPTRLAGYADGEILVALLDGVKLDGGPMEGVSHTFELDAAARTSLVGYLRSLLPRTPAGPTP